VRNRVSQVLPRLPETVRTLGVTTIKSSPDLAMVVHLTSPDGRYDTLYLRNYAVLQARDVLRRIPGVGEVRLLGAGDYAMRIWPDPQTVASRGLTTGDAVRAIREQNVQVAARLVGSEPAVQYQLTVSATSWLASEQEFGDIVVKTGTDGSVTRLRAVARVELGAGG
jgi:multidrug efflux pump subunit AcrB